MPSISPLGEAPEIYPSAELVKKICPDSPLKNIQQNLPLILNAMANKGLTSRNQAIAILATVYVETIPFKPIKEYGRGRGNYGLYYGRGFSQLTFRENYEAYKAYSGIDVVNNPDLALQPEIAADILVWYWQGGAGNPDITPYAERGDWYNVRSIVNGGRPGVRGLYGMNVFLGAIERGESYLQQGIQANTQGNLPGNYGINCADGFPQRVYSDLHNVRNSADAIISALGLATNDNWQSHEFKGTFNVAANPDLLTVRSQRKIQLLGLGEDLDGEFLVDNALLIKDRNLQLNITAHKKDPDATEPIIFRHDADLPLVSPIILAEAKNISEKIWLAARANLGKSTADGPAAGKKASAYSLGKYCILPAGIKPLGSGGLYGSNAVNGVLQALRNGRGVKVDRKNAIPGDIWADSDGDKHIGIVYENNENGAFKILSNSSSRAEFSWLDTVENMESWYPNSSFQFWRVTS